MFQVSEGELLLDRLAAAVLETVIDSIFLLEVGSVEIQGFRFSYWR